MEDSKRKARRKHSPELKSRVLLECAQQGASVAGIAQAHGLNANLVHRWLRLAPASAQGRPASGTDERSGAFMAVQLAQPAQASPPAIRIELRRGATAISIHWPVQGASDCAAWLRDWLR